MSPTTPESLRHEVERSLKEIEKTKSRHIPWQALVSLNIHPNALPGEAVDSAKFFNDIHGKFGARFDDSKIRETLPPELQAQIRPEMLVAMAFRRKQKIEFVGGILRLEGIARLTTIEAMGIGSQSVTAAVSGSTQEAMLLCKQLCLSLWDAAGVARRWEDLEPYVEAASYKTTTLSDLGFPLRRLLTERLNQFLDSRIDGDNGLGRRMGRRWPFFAPAQKLGQDGTATSYCQRIELIVSRFDRVSGAAEDCEMTFLINSREDANRSRTKVMTELPIDEHIELLDSLITMIAS